MMRENGQPSASAQATTCEIPRFLIAAASSGSGKTTITSGLLRCLARRRVDAISYKCGPDYIDPMFHRSVLGTPCRNLDLFFSTEDEVKTLLAESSENHDIAVLEGVMGFYDGLGGSGTQASAYHLACATETPVILVVNGRGSSLTLVASIKGIVQFRDDSNIAGVILNRCSKAVARMLGPAIQKECGIPVLGCLEDNPDISFESRHLGLVTADEVSDLDATVNRIADMLEETVDLEAVWDIARSAPAFTYEPSRIEPVCETEPVIAVARDAAFSFYYEENLELFRKLGARIEFFSPILDDGLADGACAVYLGGGYPELHAGELSANHHMLASIHSAHDEGMPIFAECGGFLYLMDGLTGFDGQKWPLAGVIEGTAVFTGRLQRFGYVELTARRGGLGVREGETIRAHEFHYYDSDANGDAFRAVKPVSGREWECGVVEDNLLAGFPHLYLPACPEVARRIVKAAAAFQASGHKQGKGEEHHHDTR